MAKILVVDDDIISRKLMARILSSCGHDIDAHCCAADALASMKNISDIDLIVTDWIMPEMNGGELIVAARKLSGYADIPVLVVSGEVGRNEINSEQFKVTKFMAKPVDYGLLVEWVGNSLSVAKQRREDQE